MAHTYRCDSDYEPHPTHRINGREIGKAVTKATRTLIGREPKHRTRPVGEIAAWVEAQEAAYEEDPDALDQVLALEAARESVLIYRPLNDPQVLAMHRRERRLQAAEDLGRAIIRNS